MPLVNKRHSQINTALENTALEAQKFNKRRSV